MLSITHETILLESLSARKWGTLAGLFPSVDNRACAFLTIGPEKKRLWTWQKQSKVVRIVFRQQICFEESAERVISPVCAMAPDGKQLATARCVAKKDGEPEYQILINGRGVYSCPGEALTSLLWLDESTLIWHASQHGRRERSADEGLWYRNGQALPNGAFGCEVLRDQQGRRWHAVMLGEKVYRVSLDGAWSQAMPLSSAHRNHWWELTREEPFSFDEPPHQLIRYDCVRRPVKQVQYREELLPALFSEFLPLKGGGWFRLNEEASRVAFVGSRCSWTSEQFPFVYPVAVRLAQLYKSRATVYVVDHDQTWKRSYQAVGSLFYTPFGQLVAVVKKANNKICVVIDQQEGPCFESVKNVRVSSQECAVCYLAQRGDKVFRVTVPLM